MINVKTIKDTAGGGITALLFMIFFAAFFSATHVHAASTANFDPGNIISDSVFTNNGSMNVSQIQTFLNAKVPSCDTQGTQTASEFGSSLTHAQYAASRGWPAPPYTCLKDYTENGLTSAQIINNVAQQYQINPQVLIVLLQKEQGLVTDTWPLSSQYKTATGYGCPDTAPCDSQYYGLTNQLTWSGKMFRAIMNASQTWYSPYIVGNNYIQWSPNASCGGSNVTISNRATAALYDYTPYQPNQAALNAGYGNGDSCSAYGNRNFYLYFNDWFGSTTDGIELFQADGGTGLYAVYGGQKQAITSSAVQAAWGLNRLPVNVVPQSTIDGMPSRATPLSRAAVNPFSSASNPSYLLADNGGTFDSFGPMLSNWGFNPSQASQIGYQLVAYTTRLGVLNLDVSAPGQGCIFLMDGGKLRCYSSPTTMRFWSGSSPQTTSISSSLFSALPTGSGVFGGSATVGGTSYLADNGLLVTLPSYLPVFPASTETATASLVAAMPRGVTATRLMAAQGVPGIFLIDGGKRLGLNSMDLLNSYLGPGESRAITSVSADTLLSIPQGQQIITRFAYFASTPNTIAYIDNGAHTLSNQINGHSFGIGLSDAAKTIIGTNSSSCTAGFVSGAAGNTGIYMLEAGYRRPVTSLANYQMLNSNLGLCVLPQEDFLTIPAGPQITPYVTDGTTNYLLANNKRYAVDTAIAASWGLTNPSTITSSLLQTYTSSGTLPTQLRVNGRYIFVTGGSYYSTTKPAMAAIWGINDTSPLLDSQALLPLTNKGELAQFAYSMGSRGGIYLVDGSNIYGISNLNHLFNAGYTGQPLIGVDDNYIASRLSPTNWQGYAAKDSTTNQVYILDYGYKHPIPASQTQNWLGSGGTTVTPTTLSSQYLSLLISSSNVTSSVASSAIPGIFGMTNGQHFGIPNMTVYNQSYAPYTPVAPWLINSLP